MYAGCKSFMREDCVNSHLFLYNFFILYEESRGIDYAVN